MRPWRGLHGVPRSEVKVLSGRLSLRNAAYKLVQLHEDGRAIRIPGQKKEGNVPGRLPRLHREFLAAARYYRNVLAAAREAEFERFNGID